ncbi:hypothetical protein ACQ4LE_010000 [Meloidogyne hapla]
MARPLWRRPLWRRAFVNREINKLGNKERYIDMLLHKSRKDCEKYSHNGFCYVKDRESSDGEIIFWRCDEKGRGCKGRTTVSLQNIAVQQQVMQ